MTTAAELIFCLKLAIDNDLSDLWTLYYYYYYYYHHHHH